MALSVLTDKRGNELCTFLYIVSVLDIKHFSAWSIELNWLFKVIIQQNCKDPKKESQKSIKMEFVNTIKNFIFMYIIGQFSTVHFMQIYWNFSFLLLYFSDFVVWDGVSLCNLDWAELVVILLP